jgi:CubicO group peptidase (beta-lactamase class C family)
MPPDAPTLTDPALAGYSVDRLVRAFCDYTLTRPPGRWEYSNWDTSLLGHLLARRIGMDFEAAIEQRVTRPLGLTSTAVEPTRSMRMPVSHSADLTVMPRLRMGAFAPAGGFMSTADDMLTLAAALLELTSSPLAGLLDVMTATRRPIRPSLVRILRDNWRTALRMIFSPPEGMRSAVRYFSGAEAGLAWFIFKKGRREMIVHDGGAPGSQGSLAIDRQARTAVVVLSNTGINIHDVARHVLWPDYPLSRARTEVNVATSALDRYIGTYQVAKGPAFGITRGNGRLTLTFPVWGPLVLRAENDHDFFLPELDCEIRFAAGGVIREMVMQPGRGWPSFPIPKVGQ